MNYHTITDPDDEAIWNLVCSRAGETFHTARGLPFSYYQKVSRTGELLGELVFDRKGKTITRNTVLLAYRKAEELMESEGCVSGPKKLGVFGASYLYPVFLKLGICRKDKNNDFHTGRLLMTDTKGRLLFLEHYLLEHTDEEHKITTAELISLYEAHGFHANRNTIKDDIKTLQSAGVDVLGVRVGNAKGYYIAGRSFDLAELKTLVDAVSSSRFISKNKSDELIRKIAELTNEENRKTLLARSGETDRIKAEAPGVFVTVDTIANAIEARKKISFQYIDYLLTKEVILRHDGKVYTVSPYTFLWNDDRYYILSYSEELNDVVGYRVDRMRNVRVTDEDALLDESFDAAEYSRKVLKMFDGNLPEEEVTLVAENRFMINVIDRFGEEIETAVIDNEHFRAKVIVAPSSTFFSWVFQFRGGIRVVGPEHVKRDYEDMLSTVLSVQ